MNGKDDKGMFCHKCGAKAIEGAAFCQKCGAKLTSMGNAQTMPNVASVGQESAGVKPMPDVSPVTLTQTVVPESRESDFKTFVDAHVKEVSGFQSAEELLKSRVLLGYLKKCYGICVIVWLALWILSVLESGFEGMIMGFLFLFLVAPFGLFSAYFIGERKKLQYIKEKKPYITTEEQINPDELIQFLNNHLQYLSPYFDGWNYFKDVVIARANLAGAVRLAVTALENAEIRLGAVFGKEHKYLCHSVIHIHPCVEGRQYSGKTRCTCEAKDRMGNIFGAEYDCLVRTAPILLAAMEYYLNEYKTKKDNLSASD